MKKKNNVPLLILVAVIILGVYIFARGGLGGLGNSVDRSNLPGQANSSVIATPNWRPYSSLTCSSVKLNWEPVSNARGYEVYGPSSVCNVQGSAGYCGNVSSSSTSKTINGLAPNTVYSGLTPGREGFTVLAYRNHSYSAPATRLTIDNTAACGGQSVPIVSITTPANGITVTTPTISLSGGSTNATMVKWSINGSAYQTAAGVNPWNVSSVTLQPNSNTISAIAYDASNNASTTATITVTYNQVNADTVAPTTTTAAPGGWATTNIARTLTCTDAGTPASGCAATYWKFVAPSTACGTTGYTTGTAVNTTTEGQYRLCYYSTDNASNTETPKFQEIFKLDGTAPTGSITAPASGATVSGTAVTLSRNATDALSGVATVVLKIDGATVTSPWSSTSVSNGPHGINATITDVAGNTFTTPTVNFTVSNVGPVNIVTPVLSSTGTTCNATTITWPGVAGATRYELYGPSGACNALYNGSPSAGFCGHVTHGVTNSFNVTGLTPNTAYNQTTGIRAGFAVVAFDTALGVPGNNSPSGAPKYTGVTTLASCGGNAAPVVTITAPNGGSAYTSPTNSLASLAATVTDDVSVSSVTWTNQATGATGTMTFSGGTWTPTSSIALNSGANNIVVTGSDGTLTTTDSINVTYTAAGNTAPTVTIDSPNGGTSFTSASSTVLLNGTASDVGGSVASVKWSLNGGAQQTATGTTSWNAGTVTLVNGITNTIIVTATDNLGLTSTDSISITYGTQASASPWPASPNGTAIGGGLTSLFEPSGAFWNPADQMLYFVSDHGMVTKMDQNGGNVSSYTVAANLEGITGTGANAAYPSSVDRVYVVDEDTSRILEICAIGPSCTVGATTKTWTLPSSIIYPNCGSSPTCGLNPGANLGAEGLAWVPNGSHIYPNSSSGGLFYVGSQSNGVIYVVDVNLATSGSSPVLKGTITPQLVTSGTPNIGDLSYAPSTNKLFVLYPGLGVIQEMRPSGFIVDEYRLPTSAGAAQTEEAIATIPTCSGTQTSIVLGHDPAGSHHVFKYANYPQPCVDVSGPQITAVAAAPTSNTALISWNTDEPSDSRVEYGPAFGSNLYSVTLKTTNHSFGIQSGLSPNTTYQYRVISKDQHGNVATSSPANFTTTGGGGGTDPVIVAMGDIAGSTSSGYKQAWIGSWIKNNRDTLGIAAILGLGDLAYSNGAPSDFTDYFDPHLGTRAGGNDSLKPLLKPAPGNHEYYTSGASGYYGYFNGGNTTGQAGTTGQGYYSYTIGDWKLIALNSNIARDVGSLQYNWLQTELTTNTRTCTIAYLHHPRWSNGTKNDDSSIQPIWNLLTTHKAEMLLTGHEHGYARYEPLNSAGTVSSTGVREFIVGTGGTPNYYSMTVNGNTPPYATYLENTLGVLKLTLHPTSYDFQFIKINNSGGTSQTVMDSSAAPIACIN